MQKFEFKPSKYDIPTIIIDWLKAKSMLSNKTHEQIYKSLMNGVYEFSTKEFSSENLDFFIYIESQHIFQELNNLHHTLFIHDLNNYKFGGDNTQYCIINKIDDHNKPSYLNFVKNIKTTIQFTREIKVNLHNIFLGVTKTLGNDVIPRFNTHEQKRKEMEAELSKPKIEQKSQYKFEFATESQYKLDFSKIGFSFGAKDSAKKSSSEKPNSSDKNNSGDKSNSCDKSNIKDTFNKFGAMLFKPSK
jgi:hypothetical protein